jgi:hypothetical protein
LVRHGLNAAIEPFAAIIIDDDDGYFGRGYHSEGLAYFGGGGHVLNTKRNAMSFRLIAKRWRNPCLDVSPKC